jgi:hypothetical protein
VIFPKGWKRWKVEVGSKLDEGLFDSLALVKDIYGVCMLRFIIDQVND